ncbi:MAG: RtcB family protein [Kofleriaceae bacterium]|nr:RtcB family protein [Kofleriaceae bacterium]
MVCSNERVFKALARDGIAVTKKGPVFRVRLAGESTDASAEILLPDTLRLESKAVKQLVSFASVRHPAGGEVRAAFATPDFHPGTIVPVGAVVATTRDMVIPQAIGTDIQCGMRLHVSDLNVERFIAGKDELVKLLKGDLLLGTRDLPMRVSSMKAIFDGGCMAWLDDVRGDPLGRLSKSSMAQLSAELDNIYGLGSYDGLSKWAPSCMVPDNRDVVRDPSLATIGGGNHFVEIQVVEEVMDRRRAFEWGVKPGQVVFMIHSGSRMAGVSIGNYWIERAKKEWPSGLSFPRSGIFPLHGDSAQEYLVAMNSASNYASVNRLLLAEIVRLRVREVYGHDREVPLLFDVPHNVILEEGGLYIHRKGATPAHFGQPVLIPGSMGHSSYLMAGLGNARYLNSASHGAGRAKTRYQMKQGKKKGIDLGLSGVECITLKEERLVQEAPAAYKPIEEVVGIQADVGIVAPVARMRPLLTFKA